jgi:exonuclease III
MNDNTVYINVYIPQGQKIGSEKYVYKLKFMKALQKRVEELEKHAMWYC